MGAAALLVDGPNVTVRAVRAMERPGQSALGVSGVATGPLLIFINTLSKYIREVRPGYVLIAWDGGASAYRRKIDASYKAARREVKSEAEDSAFALCKEFCTVAGIPHVERAFVEADDILAYYSRRYWPSTLLSSDKDMMQLIGLYVEQIRLSSAGTPTDRWSITRVLDVMNCWPHQLPLAMAIAGDPGDGVAGVPGYGMKTAIKTLRKADWNLDRALSETPRLHPYRDLVQRNLSLVDLTKDLPGMVMPVLQEFCPTKPGDLLYENLLAFLTRYRLDTVKARLYSGGLWQDEPHGSAQASDRAALFDL